MVPFRIGVRQSLAQPFRLSDARQFGEGGVGGEHLPGTVQQQDSLPHSPQDRGHLLDPAGQGLVGARVEAGVLDGQGCLGGDGFQYLQMRDVVGVRCRVGLHRDHAQHALPREQGHAQPADCGRPHLFHPQACCHRVHLTGDQQRTPGAQHVFGQAVARLPGAPLHPLAALCSQGKGDLVRLGIVQRHVKVPRPHQARHLVVDRLEHAPHVQAGAEGLAHRLQAV